MASHSDTESEGEDKGQLCGDCGSPGAFWLCCGCAETYYCNRACEKNSWKRGDHKGKCAELQAKQKAALLGKHGPDPAVACGVGGGVAAAASGGGVAAATAPVSAEGEKRADTDPAHPCRDAWDMHCMRSKHLRQVLG
jgi:hypothetical protein